MLVYLKRVDESHDELWAINSDGSNERQLVSASELSEMDPGVKAVVPYHFQFIPGTHTLAYNTREVLDGPGLQIYNDLRLVDAGSGKQSTLLAPGLGGEFYFSPDGQQIAVVTPTEISLVNIDGSNRRDKVLKYKAVITHSEAHYYAHPYWAPDSQSLQVAIPPEEPLEDPMPLTFLYKIPTDGSPATQTGSLQAMFFGGEVSFSPDLAHLAYLRKADNLGLNQRELHMASGDGTNDQIYTTGPSLQFHSWSPDAIHFIFTQVEPAQYQLGQVGAAFQPLQPDAASIITIHWIGQNETE